MTATPSIAVILLTLWFPVHNQVQTIAYRSEKKGYHFARASWIALFYDVRKA